MTDDSPDVKTSARSLRGVVSAVAMAPPTHHEGLRALELLVAIHRYEVLGAAVPALMPLFEELDVISQQSPEDAKRMAGELAARLVAIDQWIYRFGDGA